jgi:hypothetical protein
MILLAGLNSLDLGGHSPFPPVPPEYVPLQYIECGLDTGQPEIYPPSGLIAFDDTIKLSCEFLQPAVTTGWMYFFYTWEFSQRSFKIEGSNSRVMMKWNSTTGNEQNSYFTSGPFEATCSKSVCEINGVQYTRNVGSPDSGVGLGRIFHFAQNQSCRAYSFDVIDSNGVYTHHLVPSKRISDGILGFYDVVAESFCSARNGWTIAGPEL